MGRTARAGQAVAKGAGAQESAGARERRASWKQDPEAVKADILRVARTEFARSGLSGGRIDEIAARTRTSKRMIYYYFGDKEGLYRKVLESEYRAVRDRESRLDLDGLSPEDALARLTAFTFDHHRDNPEFVRLVMIENIHEGRHLQASEEIRGLNAPAIESLHEICRRGRESGVFRQDLDPVELHWTISALSFFNISNQATFHLIFGGPTQSGEHERRRALAVEMVLRFALARPEG